ncbi:hypothetical protein K443DRAFT_544743 [Laccaria amethystina LaAM-08-1]|uniref:Uncharacterized protein n=1 Tax=Laccaria amethystina LaAM-08-1 TaxID=1095629 RepID=A0A0C9XK17_9AGAR|nr:hypothetical protein K443DRAFT_544743 [Laccaria amethystina LaAM-08-1]
MDELSALPPDIPWKRAPRIRTSSLMSPQRAFANLSPTTTRRTQSPETPGSGLTPTYVSSGCFYTGQIYSLRKAHIQTTSTYSRPLPDDISSKAQRVNTGYIPHPYLPCRLEACRHSTPLDHHLPCNRMRGFRHTIGVSVHCCSRNKIMPLHLLEDVLEVPI